MTFVFEYGIILTMERCQIKKCLNGIATMIYSAGEKGNSYNVCQQCWEKHCEGEINLKDDSIFDKDR